MQRGAPGRRFTASIIAPLILRRTRPTLRQAVHWIARLGGFLGRRADGEPGVKTIWLGFRRLADIAAAWQLMHSMLGNSPKHLWVMLSPRRGVFANRGKGVSSDALVWGRPPQQGSAC